MFFVFQLEKEQKLAVADQVNTQQNSSTNLNRAEQIVKKLLVNVEQAADALEEGMKKDKVFEESIGKKGAKLETVVKLEEDEEDTSKEKEKSKEQSAKEKARKSVGGDEDEKGPKKHEAAMSVLIDSKDNLYVLAKPAESTVTHQDLNLLRGISTLIMLAFALGALCRVIGLPVFFGYVLSGIILGPACLNRIKVRNSTNVIGVFYLPQQQINSVWNYFPITRSPCCFA